MTAHLLQAADELLASQGLEITFNALAHHAGVGVGTVYRHFANTTELLEALLEKRLAVIEGILEAAATADDPLDALREAIFHVCELQAKDRGTWQALTSIKSADQLGVRRIDPLAQRLVDRVNQTGLLRTELAPADCVTMLFVAGALVEQSSSLNPQLWRRYITLMLNGFVSDERAGDLPMPPAPDLADLRSTVSPCRS
jgi:AcrR family transcriptional regulator